MNYNLHDVFNAAFKATVYMLSISNVRFVNNHLSVGSNCGGTLISLLGLSVINVAYADSNLSFTELDNILVDVNTDNSYIYPVVTRLSKSKFVVAWSTQYKTFAKIYTNTGAQVGDAINIANSGNIATSGNNAVIASLSDGNFIINRDNYVAATDTWDSYAQIYTDLGVKVGDSFMISNKSRYSGSLVSIASSSNGNFVISWSDDKFYSQVYTNIGTPINNRIVIDEKIYGRPLSVVLNNGNFVISWREQNGYNSYVYVQTYDLTGAKVGTKFIIISGYYNNELGKFSMAALSNNNLVVVWDSFKRDSLNVPVYGLNIYGQIFNSMGDRLGNQFLVPPKTAIVYSSITYNYNGYPKVISSFNEDNFIVTWNIGYTYNQDRDVRSGGICGQLFNNLGVKTSAVFPVALPGSTSIGWAKDITKLTNNIFVSVYTSGSLFAKIFALNNDSSAYPSPSPSSSPSNSANAISPSSSLKEDKSLSSPSPDLLSLSTSSACTNKPILVNFIASGISLLNLAKNNVNSWWYRDNNLSNREDSCLKNYEKQGKSSNSRLSCVV